VQAIYEAENIQFSDLKDASALNTGKVKTYRGPVWVVATLKDKLMHPAISFEIQLPPNSDMRNDAGAGFILSQINNDPSELNKQVAFLLVFNSFGPMNTSGAVYSANEAGLGIVVSSISSYISNELSSQFSTYFQRIFKDKSIRVNFNTAVYNGTALETSSQTTQTSSTLVLPLSRWLMPPFSSCLI
jgi:hypothetical protein